MQKVISLLTPTDLDFKKKLSLLSFFLSKKTYNCTMKIFYLGPEGTNSDLASRAIFDKSFSFVPTNSIEDIFEKVALSHSYYGVQRTRSKNPGT